MAKELSIMMVGDIFIGKPHVYPHQLGVVPLTKPRADLFSWIERVAPVLQRGDFTLGNLEGYICEREPDLTTSISSFRGIRGMPPETAGVLKRAGFKAVTTANNHAMNMGAEPMLESLSHLDRAGIAHSGSGRNLAEARKPAILKQDGVTLAVLAYTSVFAPGFDAAGENKPGVAPVTVNTSYEIPPNVVYHPGILPRIITIPNRAHQEQVLKDVRRAKAEADVVVVSWHWGASLYAQSFGSGLPYEDTPSFVLNYQEDLGRAAIDAGADVIMGHHPCRLQGIEIYHNKPIFYSICHLVNSFAFPPNFSPHAVIAEVFVDAETRKLTRFAVVPMMVPLDTMEPYIIPIGEAGPLIAELQKLSRRYGTTFRTVGDEIAVEAGVPEKPLSARGE